MTTNPIDKLPLWAQKGVVAAAVAWFYTFSGLMLALPFADLGIRDALQLVIASIGPAILRATWAAVMAFREAAATKILATEEITEVDLGDEAPKE